MSVEAMPDLTHANGTPPTNVIGWLSPAEARTLVELAKGKMVLELGTFKGLSTSFLAQSALMVHSVDWHQGDSGTGATNTLSHAVNHLTNAEVLHKTILHVGKFQDVVPQLKPESFDLVFVDGDHELLSVRRDILLALEMAKPGGTIVLHDYNYPTVSAACQEHFNREPDGVCESLAWFNDGPTTKKATQREALYLAVPHYGNLVPQAIKSIFLATKRAKYTYQTNGGSLLCLVFNRLYCGALNTFELHRWTHFGMHHSDIEVVDEGWADILMDEMIRTGADVMSVVIPIKDARGLTSTGIRHEDGNIRRFTMKEIHDLPETFNGEMVGCKEGEHLALNTGLWLCKFGEPWNFEFPGFTIIDGIVKDEDGTYNARVLPEDWHFSNWCFKRGLKLWATRKVKAIHHGSAAYSNAQVFGNWQTDKGDQCKEAL